MAHSKQSGLDYGLGFHVTKNLKTLDRKRCGISLGVQVCCVRRISQRRTFLSVVQSFGFRFRFEPFRGLSSDLGLGFDSLLFRVWLSGFGCRVQSSGNMVLVWGFEV